MASEWTVVHDDTGRVSRIEVRDGEGWILTGISYWSAHDGPYLARVMEELMHRPDATSLFWDEAPRTSLGVLQVYSQALNSEHWAEVDTVEELLSLRRRIG